MTNNTVPIPHIFYVLLYIQSKIKHNSRLFKTVFTNIKEKLYFIKRHNYS